MRDMASHIICDPSPFSEVTVVIIEKKDDKSEVNFNSRDIGANRNPGCSYCIYITLISPYLPALKRTAVHPSSELWVLL